MSDDQDLTRLEQVLKVIGFNKSTKPKEKSNKKDKKKSNLEKGEEVEDGISLSDDQSSDYQSLPDELRTFNEDESVSNNNTTDNHDNSKQLQMTEESGSTTFHTSIQNAQQVHVGPRNTNFHIHASSSTSQCDNNSSTF